MTWIAPEADSVDVGHRAEQARFVAHRVEPAAGPFDRRLPRLIGNQLAHVLLVVGADEVERHPMGDGRFENLVELAAFDERGRVLTIGEDDHEVARGLEELERLEQLETLFERARDDRSPIREAARTRPGP